MDARSDTRKRTLTTLIAAIFAALLCVTLAGPAGAADDDDGGEFVSRQVVVKLASTAVISEINKEYGTTTIETLLGSSRIYLLRTPQNANPETLAERMESDTNRLRRVIYAEPNFRTELPEASRQHRARPGGEPTPSSDPAQYRSQYAIGAMNLSEAHTTTRGAGSIVAVIDTGVQLSHPQLSGRLTEVRYDFIDDDREPSDTTSTTDSDGDGQLNEMVGHGTHVAGIVGLTAPEARIMPIRALNPDGWGDGFVLAEAIDYAAKNGADVINLSLGTSQESELVADVIENAAEGEEGLPGDTVVVVAAGNENADQLQYPAATGYEPDVGKDYEESALAVASVNQQRAKSSFSNYGAWVDIAAPGSEIYSAFPSSRYALWDGTSMATPFVAGQAALLHGEAQTAPEEKVACISNVIAATAQPLENVTLGAGHADAGASVEYLRSMGCPPPQGG